MALSGAWGWVTLTLMPTRNSQPHTPPYLCSSHNTPPHSELFLVFLLFNSFFLFWKSCYGDFSGAFNHHLWP